MRPFAVTAALVAALTLSAAADDAVEIKPPALKAGDKFKVTKHDKSKTAETLEAGGKKTGKDKNETRLSVYTDEVLTAGGPGEKPAKLVRVYEKHEATGGKEGPAPPLKTPITIAKKGDKFEFTADKPLGEFTTVLDREFNRTNDVSVQDFLPGKPVKAGDSWKIDAVKFAKSLAQDKLTVDAAKSAVTGKLLKAYKKDGKQFGVLEIDAVFPMKDLGNGGATLKSGVIKTTINADVCIDGTDNSESTKMSLVFELVAEVKDVTVTVKSDGTQTITKELFPRK